MESEITLAAGELRPHLLRRLAVEADKLAGELTARREAAQARAHYARVAAVASLLERIGWAAPAGADVARVDPMEHGWAAAEALRALIQCEELRVERHAAAEDAEAAGEAMGRRADAAQALALLEEAAERNGASIAAPPC